MLYDNCADTIHYSTCIPSPHLCRLTEENFSNCWIPFCFLASYHFWCQSKLGQSFPLGNSAFFPFYSGSPFLSHSSWNTLIIFHWEWQSWGDQRAYHILEPHFLSDWIAFPSYHCPLILALSFMPFGLIAMWSFLREKESLHFLISSNSSIL